MTQATPTIGANKSGLQYRNEDNDGKKALLSHHKGSAAPSYAEAGIIWLDDTSTPWILKIHDGTDWITLGEVHATNNTFKPYNGTAQTVCNYTEASIASATTTDLGTLSGNMALVSGTTTITSLGSSASTARPLYFVRFSGALTLTYNATSLILPTAAAITTAAGDSAVFEYLGSGNWKCLGYNRQSGAPLTLGVEGAIASAATTDLGTIGVNILSITGSTTITSLGSAAVTSNPLYFVRFAGALTLTHNASSLILPGSANITTAAGDNAEFKYEGSGNWRCVKYMKADGTAVVGTSLSQASTTEIANESAVTKYISPDRLSSSKRLTQSWTNFDASSGTPTNVSSFNVSSFTDNGTGDTTVNFTNALRDANYAVAGVGTSAASTAMCAKVHSSSTGGAPTTKSTTACRVAMGTTVAQDGAMQTFIFI